MVAGYNTDFFIIILNMKVGYYIMAKSIFNSSIVDNANMNITHIKTKTRTKHGL